MQKHRSWLLQSRRILESGAFALCCVVPSVGLSTLVACTSNVVVLESRDSGFGVDDGSRPLDAYGVQIPDTAYCAPVTVWNSAFAQLESGVLVRVNQLREQGASCGTEGVFQPTSPLLRAGSLLCAARVHSKDMGDRSFFGHDNPDGESSGDRILRADYVWSVEAENIANGSSTPDDVVGSWMANDVTCARMMNPVLVHVGVGFYPTGNQWTHVFAAPAQ